MHYTVNQLYQLLYQKVDDVYAVFSDFFGEEHVDLHKADKQNTRLSILHILGEEGVTGLDDKDFDKPLDIADSAMAALHERLSTYKSAIYVWWPQVTVTNEYDKSVNIQDLYAEVDVQMDGRIPFENTGFFLGRATYSIKQFLSNYMHSHIQRIPKENLSSFMPPCLGQGPIKGTIATLKVNYDEASWMLFCQELALYVTVESIAGGPWKRMEEIGGRQKLYTYGGYHSSMGSRCAFTYLFPIDKLQEFIKYYLQHGHLSLSFKNGYFSCGMPYHEYIIDISNAFIEFYNAYLASSRTNLNSCFSQNLLCRAVMVGSQFYSMGGSYNQDIANLSHYQGKYILTFKGKEILLSITPDSNEEEVTPVTLLNNNVALYVLGNILRIINYRYKNEYKNTNPQGCSQTPASSPQGVIYI